jgi:hypothetical protein
MILEMFNANIKILLQSDHKTYTIKYVEPKSFFLCISLNIQNIRNFHVKLKMFIISVAYVTVILYPIFMTED